MKVEVKLSEEEREALIQEWMSKEDAKKVLANRFFRAHLSLAIAARTRTEVLRKLLWDVSQDRFSSVSIDELARPLLMVFYNQEREAWERAFAMCTAASEEDLVVARRLAYNKYMYQGDNKMQYGLSYMITSSVRHALDPDNTLPSFISEMSATEVERFIRPAFSVHDLDLKKDSLELEWDESSNTMYVRRHGEDVLDITIRKAVDSDDAELLKGRITWAIEAEFKQPYRMQSKDRKNE